MKQQKTDIADYDATKYDYEQYWKGRSYENAADNIALQRLLELEKSTIAKNDVYIDIGSSYGRQAVMYQSYFTSVILYDYSLESLKKAKRYCEKQGLQNVYCIAGDLYHMPFANGSLHAGQMVRVMHHLKDIPAAFTEIDRVISNFFILEFANKIHAKYRAKHLFTSIDHEPMQQVFRKTSQGSHGDNQIFLNFHPEYIKKMLKRTNFSLQETLSVSNFRIPVLKKIFGDSTLTHAEKLLQKTLASVSFGPSIYYLLEKQHSSHTPFSLEASLCCSACKGSLDTTDGGFYCNVCKKGYPIIDGVYDFR